MWPKLRKIVSPKNCLIIVIVLLMFLFYSYSNMTKFEEKDRNSITPIDIDKIDKNAVVHVQTINNNKSENAGRTQTNTRMVSLVFLKDGYTPNSHGVILNVHCSVKTTCLHSVNIKLTELGRSIVVLLEAVRFQFHTQFGPIKNLPTLMDKEKGRYSAIIFEDANMYLALNRENRNMIDRYCSQFSIGIILFLMSDGNSVENQQFGEFPLKYSTNMEVSEIKVNEESNVLRITRPGTITDTEVTDWTVFATNHKTYQPIVDIQSSSNKKQGSRKKRSTDLDFFFDKKEQNTKKSTSVLDLGLIDEVQKIYFGADFQFWLHKPLVLDALSYLSNGKLEMPLERFIQIDIDDIFVGVKNTRMTALDVEALYEFQTKMKTRVPGFEFHLGYSGKFYQRGTPEENEGDAKFFEYHNKFRWFPHMWSHMQAHWFETKERLCEYMHPNVEFSKRHHFNTSSHYAVAPHHSGVFPVHQPLYDCWKEMWDIRVTSTEEYPHLRPDHLRRGFIYDGIMVLPRQTCGLFTHTIFLDKYPEGKHKLESLINGGSLFESFLYQKFNIFMTHLSNYGNDRLALYTFGHAFDFVQKWTNLQLQQIEPVEMAKKYFDIYPNEKDPIWLNPCLDGRHKEIWSSEKTCDRLPQFVIVGPQKTGTSALHTFLLMHPDLKSSLPSPKTFEEVQFFNGDNYMKGIDWYMDNFPMPGNESTVLFEKSANYFDQLKVPQRLNALLPKAFVVILLVDPAKRAYSWYQHMRAHNDKTAMNYDFDTVVRATRTDGPPELLSLQNRCLEPGLYGKHLSRWLEYIPSNQVIVEDGNLLKTDPAVVLERLQHKLPLSKYVDYSKRLQFDEKKGFFCEITEENKVKCLGKGKGREYPEMSQQSKEFLYHYYRESNIKLAQLLVDLKQPLPTWYKDKSVT